MLRKGTGKIHARDTVDAVEMPAVSSPRAAGSRRAYTTLDTSAATGLPIPRFIPLLIVLIPLGAIVLLANTLNQPLLPGDLRSINIRELLGADDTHFLPSPVAVIPPKKDAGPSAPAEGDAGSAAADSELVKVANTGGLGVYLRQDPPQGRPVAGLRDGQVLHVLERRQVGDAEWLHVRTDSGAEGWVFGRLVGPA